MLKMMLLGGAQPEDADHDYRCEIIGERETGLVFRDTPAHIEVVRSAFQSLQDWMGERPLLCGISAPAHCVGDIQAAVRQAHIAMPQKQGLDFYNGTTNPGGFTRMQQERFYQGILSDDEEGALKMLSEIASCTHSADMARGAFYSLHIMLRSAAEELDVPLVWNPGTVYDATLRPEENLMRMEQPTRELFRSIHEKQESTKADKEKQLLQWVRSNSADCNLSALVAAEYFEVPEKRIYEMVRRATNMTFREYLLSVRMKKAASLLCTTNYSINEITEKCGYQAVSTFYRIFKKYYDVTPSEFRARGGTDGSLTLSAEETDLLEAEQAETSPENPETEA